MPFPPPAPLSLVGKDAAVSDAHALWRRFGGSPEEAAHELAHNRLTADEKGQLLRGYGWDGYTQRYGHYTGNIRGIVRLGLPSIRLQDAGAGFRTMHSRITGTVTSFPSALAAAATWDRALVSRYARAIGEEFKAKGTNVILGQGRCASAVLGLSLNDETPTNPPPALSISDALQSVSVTIIDYQSGKQCRLDVVLVDGVDSQDVELSGLVVVG